MNNTATPKPRRAPVTPAIVAKLDLADSDQRQRTTISAECTSGGGPPCAAWGCARSTGNYTRLPSGCARLRSPATAS
jgi:hypothetical protein